MRALCYRFAMLLLFGAILSVACGNEETGMTTNQTENQGGNQTNQDQICIPGESTCDGDDMIRCNADGTGYLAPTTCDSGVCTDGQCGCADIGDCPDGETCSGGLCVCESKIQCAGTCCGDGEVCAEIEICDDGQCENVSLCRPECDGSFCGADGDICCDGDTPICGPTGQCAPDCSNGGGLCGDNFDECCAWGDACVFGECRTMGEPCENFAECNFGEYCDPGLGRCMPDDFPEDLVCEQDYDFEEFETEFLWRWEGVEVGGTLFKNVAMTPVVADLNGDGKPEVAVNAYPSGSAGSHMLVVISGTTGETLYYNNTRWARTWSQLALVDVTDDGLPEIVTGNSSGIGVVKNLAECPEVTDDDDCYLWWNSSVAMDGESLLVADINADGNVEILVNDTVLDGATGQVLAQKSGSRGYDYTVVADITGNGSQEILSERCLLTMDSDLGQLDELWCNDSLPNRGMRFAAVGDVAASGPSGDRVGEPEFVITGNGNLYIVEAETGEIIEMFSIPGEGSGGPPIIADFDGDDGAEVGIAGSGCYTVFDLDCLGSTDEDQNGCARPEIPSCTPGVDCVDVQACPDLDSTQGTGDGILWSVYIQDISSSRTGSSVFDFQGDGKNEVVYNDECLLMVLDGQTGSPLFRHANTTRTASEYPIVVDVNGDTRTNFVVASNNDQFNRDCAAPIQDRPDRYPECHGDGPHPDWCTQGTVGVVALQDPEDRWVRTRQIWNQFSYHIDNVTDDAQAPTSPSMPWQTHNTFRANRQGEVPLNAADVSIFSVQTTAASCPPDIELQVAIENQGVASIPPGIPVSLYDIDRDEYVYTTALDQPIPPGGIITLPISYQVPTNLFNTPLNLMVIANDDGIGDGEGMVYDCNPDKATIALDTLECRVEL